MSKQVNLYLKKNDFEKIQKYLLEKKFVFIKDEITKEPTPVFCEKLFDETAWANLITFSDARLDYLQWEKENQSYFRLWGTATQALQFSFLDEKNAAYKVSFYYENTQNIDLEQAVKRFFAWLRRNFEKIPDMPTFYKSPDLGLENYF